MNGVAVDTHAVTVTAPSNIAVVKYWGKRCSKYNLPMNSSLSITMNQDELHAMTTVATETSFERDEIILNGQKMDVESNNRLTTCLSEMRRLARKQYIDRNRDNKSVATDLGLFSQKVHILSNNNFPTAAGLASSAAGYAALVYALAKLYSIQGDVTTVARQGSGSACRSLHGGFVEWKMGCEEDGRDSISVQLFGEDHWPELRIIIMVVNKGCKNIGSTEAMNRCSTTSTLLQHRCDSVVQHRMRAMNEAIHERDFISFAELTMKESNQLHAVCLDAFPPISYLNETSHKIIDFVHRYNTNCVATRLAYTFDAGPNACLFTTVQHFDEVCALISKTFPPLPTNKNYFRGIPSSTSQIPLPHVMDSLSPGSVQYIICTRPGPGPILVSTETGIN